jgi:hypothetical protein
VSRISSGRIAIPQEVVTEKPSPRQDAELAAEAVGAAAVVDGGPQAVAGEGEPRRRWVPLVSLQRVKLLRSKSRAA